MIFQKLIFLFLFIPLGCFSQENNQQKKNPDDVNFSFKTEQEPYYPAGDNVLFAYFYNNIKYSDEAKAKNISGNIMISFDVMPDSSLTNIIVLSGVGFGIDEELVKLIEPLKYAPGIQSGVKTKMNVILTIPVKAQ